MPIIQIYSHSGRTIEEKQSLVEGITEATCKALNVLPEKVQIIISDLLPENYAVSGKLKSHQTPPK